MELTVSYAIAVAAVANKAAYVDPTTGIAAVPSVAKAKCLGIFPTDVLAAEGYAPVKTAGIQSAIFGASASFGDSLTVDAYGRLVPASGSSGDKVWCVGYSEGLVLQAGDIGDMRIHPHLVVI